MGVGDARAEERLFQMEVLRHGREGTLSEPVGSGPKISDSTIDFTVRLDSETDIERLTQIATHLNAGQQASLTRFTTASTT